MAPQEVNQAPAVHQAPAHMDRAHRMVRVLHQIRAAHMVQALLLMILDLQESPGHATLTLQAAAQSAKFAKSDELQEMQRATQVLRVPVQ